MRIIDYSDAEAVSGLITRPSVELGSVTDSARAILEDVRGRGDAALYEYTKRFDGFALSGENVRVPKKEIRKARSTVGKDLTKALEEASGNIERFHSGQFDAITLSKEIRTAKGIKITERTIPLASVGCYVPGGRATYPSTVLMTCTPARVAGVERIVVVSPPPIKPEILAACDICGVDEVYRVGGAQAVAALAYGTDSIRPVDKIVGPGNKYVMAAKMLVYGTVDIDMPAGPSEVLIIADAEAEAGLIAADILAQAEHDPDAQSILVTNSRDKAAEVGKEIGEQMASLGRKDTIVKSLESSAAVIVPNLGKAAEFANRYAPEHLEIMTRDPQGIAARIRNAGTIFLGRYAPVPAGDYASGGNHVLPTGGTARFASELGVRDYLRTFTVQDISKDGLAGIAGTVETIARAEGLDAHAEAVRKRLS